MSGRIVRTITKAKDVTKLADYATSDNDIISDINGNIYLKQGSKNYVQLALFKDNESLKSEINSLKSENTKLKNRVTKLETSKEDFTSRIEVLEKSKEDFTSRIEVLETSKEDLTSRIEALENKDTSENGDTTS